MRLGGRGHDDVQGNKTRAEFYLRGCNVGNEGLACGPSSAMLDETGAIRQGVKGVGEMCEWGR